MNRISYERFLTGVETVFNVVGSTPFGVVSGPVRMMLGQIQAIAAFAYTAFAAIAESITNNQNKIAYYKGMEKLGVEHIIHGFANQLRGFWESTMIVSFFLGLSQLADKSFAPKWCPYTSWTHHKLESNAVGI